MTAVQLFGRSLMPVTRAIRRLLIQREQARINNDLLFIAAMRENDFRVERFYHKRLVVLQSELADLK